MKKVLGSLLVIGLMATAANAATIGLRWAGNANQNNDGDGVIEVYLQLLNGETASTVIFDYWTTATNLEVTAQGTTVPNWAAPTSSGPLNNFQFNSSANVGANLAGPIADIVVGTTTIDVTGDLDGTIKEIFFNAHANPVGVLNATGARLTWDARYNDQSVTPGYIAFGDWGNPGWIGKPGQPTANPLLITKVPEPTSLALIALGGFALLRRR